MSSSYFVGIDVSTTSCSACIQGPAGEILTRGLSFPNSPQGSQKLIDHLDAICQKNNITTVLLATEATSVYDWHLLEYLSESTLAQKYSLSLYRFNPKLIHNFKKSMPQKAKSDSQDCFVIAERLRFGRLPSPFVPNNPYLPLQRLTRFRIHICKSLVREKNFFLSNFFLKFPSLYTAKPLSNRMGAVSLSILSDFLSTEQLAEAPLEELVPLLVRKGRNHLSNPEQLAQELQKLARESYRLHPSLQPKINLILSLTLNNIRALKDALKDINKSIESEMKAFPNTIASIPGIGPVFSAGIIAEIQNIRRFPSQAHLAKFASLSWYTYQSGNFTGDDSHLMRSGNRYLRYYLVEAANSVRRYDADYQRYYQLKYNEAATHHHKRALVLTARKLVRLVYALLSEGRLYQRQGVPA